jgi:hypothetical protein
MCIGSNIGEGVIPNCVCGVWGGVGWVWVWGGCGCGVDVGWGGPQWFDPREQGNIVGRKYIHIVKKICEPQRGARRGGGVGVWGVSCGVAHSGLTPGHNARI